MKKFRWICLLLALLTLFSACNGSSGNITVATTEKNITPTTTAPPAQQQEPTPVLENPPVSDFQIIRPDVASQPLLTGIRTVNTAIRDLTGETLTIKSDRQAADETTYELLIGNTTREASQTIQALLQPGDYVIQTVISDTSVKIVVLGYNEALTIYAAERLGEMIAAEAVTDEHGNFQTLSISENRYTDYQNFRLEISDPQIVFQAENEDTTWGHYQFPQLYYTSSGAMRISWSYHTDSIYDTGGKWQWVFSTDEGNTWTPGNNESTVASSLGVLTYNPNKVLMSNGKHFAGFVNSNTYQDVNYISKYADKKVVDGATTSGVVLYYAEDIKEYEFSIYGQEYNPSTNQITQFPITVNWPYMPLTFNRSNQTGQMTYLSPTEVLFCMSNYMGMISTENGLYYCTYSRGFDSNTGKPSELPAHYSVYVFHSADNGRTWNYLSQVSMDKNIPDWNISEGFCEPSMTVTADGTFVMLMRTGSNNPSYIVRSTDNCKTWSDPEKFDNCGVLPQILTLDCGVTIASYGRPDLYVRATSDFTGKEWQDHIKIPIHDEGITVADQKSCFYTFLLQTSPTTAIMVYTDFNYPNEYDEPRRTILIRTITVVPILEEA